MLFRLLALAASCHGFAVLAPSRQVMKLPPMPFTRPPLVMEISTPPESVPEPEKKGVGAWFKSMMKIDKDTLAKSGVDAFFTYGVVSNLNAGITLSVAWGIFSRTSGLSPLAPGQWKRFLATYVAIYATAGTLLRPFRFAAAISLTPVYSSLILRVRNRLPYRDTNPKLNRTLALILISLICNTTGTLLLFGAGVLAAGAVSGVNPFPPG